MTFQLPTCILPLAAHLNSVSCRLGIQLSKYGSLLIEYLLSLSDVPDGHKGLLCLRYHAMLRHFVIPDKPGRHLIIWSMAHSILLCFCFNSFQTFIADVLHK